jgi:SAM-dependent methyltransferase
MYPKIRQTNKENQGITDIQHDVSLTRKGFIDHSAVDFTPDALGDFCVFFKKMLPDKDSYTIIEFGCGSGVMATCLPKEVFYLGLDANHRAGPEAIKLNDPNKQFLVADLTAPFTLDPPLEADIIISFDFFEHIEEHNLRNVINSADQLLKKGGSFFSIIDKYPLPEHITRKPIQQWINIFNEYTNWELVDACAEEYCTNKELWEEYKKLKPPFWTAVFLHQMLLRYKKV